MIDYGDLFAGFPDLGPDLSQPSSDSRFDWHSVLRQVLIITKVKPLEGYAWSVLSRWDPTGERIWKWLRQCERRDGVRFSERSEGDQFNLVLELFAILSDVVSLEGDSHVFSDQ
jgi:hypothetical protein